MKTGTSSLMDGKDYQQRKVIRIDDINAMADADIRENEQLEKLAEGQSKILGWGEYQGSSEQTGFKDAYINGYSKAKETLYTKQHLIDLVQSLKDYTYESHTILGHDEREASEFVETFIDVFLLKNHIKQQEQ
jgi:hypothetical protein